MDMRKFNSGFLKPDDVRDNPIQAHIVNVVVSEKYNRPVLELDNGEQFSVNATNNRVLIKAYGPSDSDWLVHLVEFALGHYKDWNTDPPEEKETVVVRPISPREKGNGSGPQRVDPAQLPKPLKDDLSDEIPF
jgi:hypothetical protein